MHGAHGMQNAGAIGSNLATEPARETKIPAAHNELAYHIQEADGLLEQLTMRLCTVLMPCPPSTPGKETGQGIRPATAPLAEMTHTHTAHVQQINANLRDLLSRLEV